VTGGTAPTVQNQPKFGQERIPVHDWQPDAIEVTTDLLEDSAASLDSIIAEVIAECLALDEDAAFLNGNGVGKPEGVLSGGSPNPGTDLGTSSTITYGGLVALYTALPGQYRQNARFLMNSATFGKILLLETTAGFPIFPPNSLPGTLFSKPIVFSEFMPSIATTAKTIVFGDFSRAYIIVDRAELRIQRLTERFAPNIGILPIKRTGGQVVRPRALRIGKHAA
jgi:HK97 family phage major capsid protein